jgi:hypothetical protein
MAPSTRLTGANIVMESLHSLTDKRSPGGCPASMSAIAWLQQVMAQLLLWKEVRPRTAHSATLVDSGLPPEYYSQPTWGCP